MTEPAASTPESHRNNLDFIRIAAAMFVLFGHSYVLTGRVEYRFLSWLPLGPLGVYVFFTISGYLVVESWRRDPHLGRFLARRALRIFPGLIVCVLLSIFVLGPAMTSIPLRHYFSHGLVSLYVWNIALYPVYPLPGVFEHNVSPGAVNGSLWSLPVEFSMYLVVMALGLVRANRWMFLLLTVAWTAAWPLWADRSSMVVFYGSDLRQVIWCGTFFMVGAVFREFGVPRWFSLSGTVLALAALLALEPWPVWLRSASWVLLPVVILSFGLARSPVLGALTRSGDYSYGVYIYAFPVQQTVAALWPGMPIGQFLLTVTAIVLPLAVLSWHFIEAPALRLKPRTPRRS